MTLEELMNKLAIEASNNTENRGIKVPDGARNPGTYIGFTLGVRAMMEEYKKLQDKVEFLEECNARYEMVVTDIMENT